MFRRIVVLVAFLSVAVVFPAYGQEVPTLAVDPTVVALGESTTVIGKNFEPGTVRIYLDGVAGAPRAEHTHRGEFNFLVEISGVTPDVHEVIACNNQSRAGACREEAVAALVVNEPTPTTTTTTSPPRTTTTTSPPRTTTTTSPPRATTTTSPSRTTTPGPTLPPTSRPQPTIVLPTTSTTSTPTTGSITTPPGTPTTQPGVAVVTTLAAGGFGVTTTPPTVPTPTGVQVAPTSPPDFDLSTSDDIDWPDLEVVGFEVTQGIQDLQNRMPLVAERTTWVRLYVAVDRLPDDAGDDALTTGSVGSEWSYTGLPDVSGALWLENDGGGGVLYPENGPITAFGDGGDRSQRDATLNFRLPAGFTADGDLDITAFVWSQLPGTPVSQEPDAANNYAGLSVEFHTAAEPTTFAVRLRNEDVWSAVTPASFDNAIAQIEESLLTYHPISGTTVNRMLFVVDPGPEVTEEEDPEGNWDLDTRGWEPNVRLGWYHALWDAADDEWFVGVAPNNASSSWSGWANPGSHAFWTMGNTTTPGHEMGHAHGLLHVPCKDTNEPFGVPDELAGGSLDLSHPNGLPTCSLAPIDPDGYYGFATRQELPSVYPNDPTALGTRFPFMSYLNPEWTDPYHTCLLLESYGVPCDPASIGVPPLVAVADFGQGDTLAQVVPDTGTWEPMLPGDPHDGPIALFELSWEACDAESGQSSAASCDAESDDGTTEQFFTVEVGEAPGHSECDGPTAGTHSGGSSGGSNAPTTTIGSGGIDINIGIGELQECTISASAPGHSECEGSTTSGSGTTPTTPTTTIASSSGPHYNYVLQPCLVVSWSEIGPALVLEQPTSGATGLLERQLAQTAHTDFNADGPVDAADLMNWQSGLGAPLWVRVSDSTGAVPGRVMPLMLDGLGHGGGVEVASESSLLAAPWDPAYDTIEIVRRDGLVLDTAVSTGAPVVSIESVVTDGREVAVSWIGDDPDGDPLLFTVSMSSDGGSTWRPLEVLTGATSFVVTDDHRAAGGDQVIVRVTATDGLATGFADSELFGLPDASPQVTISSLEPNVAQYAPRTLTASAFDPEDGVIDGITWWSDLDGELGVGRRVDTRWLTVGRHTITASVSDSAGAMASDTMVLDVVDEGRVRPLVLGDLPEVDALLQQAVVIEPTPAEISASEPEQSEPSEPPGVSDGATVEDPEDAASGSSLTVLAMVGIGIAGVGLGAAARRRRPGLGAEPS